MAAWNRVFGTDLPYAAGVAGGVGAFVAGYLVTFLVKGQNITSAFGGFDEIPISDIPLPADWQIIGWYFYQMHNVDTEVSISFVGRSETYTLSSSVDPWLALVPVAALVIAGFGVARAASAETLERGAVAGATVVLGYFVLVVVFALLVGWSASRAGGSISVGPSPVPAAILAGVLYPVVLGAIGGAAAGAVET
ncbi:MAG: hypothetical protein V5A39_11845 [Haloarculaceae archaeon]